MRIERTAVYLPVGNAHNAYRALQIESDNGPLVNGPILPPINIAISKLPSTLNGGAGIFNNEFCVRLDLILTISRSLIRPPEGGLDYGSSGPGQETAIRRGVDRECRCHRMWGELRKLN